MVRLAAALLRSYRLPVRLLSFLLSPHEAALLLAIVVVLVATAALDAQHNYLNDPWVNFVQIARQTSLLGIFALGSAIVIIAGGIDLSSGSVISFSGTICAAFLLLLAPQQMQSADTPIAIGTASLAIGATLLVGVLIGSLHAWLITVVGLPPFVATLATLVGLRSFARAICESVTESVLDGRSTQIQVFDPRFRYLATSVWIPAAIFLALAFLGWLLLSKTVTGRHLYALGGNEQAARLSGIRTDRIKWFAYCISAVLSSIAGILYVCEVSVATPLILGRGYELNSIAAAVVGGCSLQGGVGTMPGIVLGAVFLRVVIDGVAKIIKTGADVYEGLIVGVVVVFAVALSQTSSVVRQGSFFAGGLGLVAAVNLSLFAGTMAMLVGPTLLEGRVSMDGTTLGLWTGGTLFLLLLLLRSRMTAQRRTLAAAVLAVAAIGAFWGLDRGVPAYRLHAASAAVQSFGGSLSSGPDGTLAVDLRNSSLDDAGLKHLVERLRALPKLGELSLAGTQITDEGLAPLKALKGLKHVDLTGTRVTKMGRNSLSRSLPDVEIDL